jgi:hypothetical protein
MKELNESLDRAMRQEEWPNRWMTISEILTKLEGLGFWSDQALPQTHDEQAALVRVALESCRDVREDKVWARIGTRYKHTCKLTGADQARLRKFDEEASTHPRQRKASPEEGQVGAPAPLGTLARKLDRHTIELPAYVLENVVRVDRYTAIDRKLQDIVTACQTPPVWLEAWQHSMRGRRGIIKPGQEPEASPEERLAVWQAVRDSGAVTEDAGFCLVADQLGFLTEIQVGETLEEIDRRIDSLYAEYGLEAWRVEAPRNSANFLDFEDRCPLDWERLYPAMMERHGEGDMARLYRTDRERFEERVAAGMAFFCPPEAAEPPEAPPPPPAPQWVHDFLDDFLESGCFVQLGRERVNIGVRFWPHGDVPEVWLHLTPTQAVGGPHDGEEITNSFMLAIDRLCGVFDEVIACAWQPFARVPTPFTAHVLAKGTYQGHLFIVRVLHDPDEDIECELVGGS